MSSSVHHLAHQWLSQDQDPSTRAEIQSLLDTNNTAALESCLRPRISFGTAGLRARMAAGYARMNRLTVLQASQGLAAYLQSTDGHGDHSSTIVIGHDARHNSARFARVAAGAFASKGFKLAWLGQCHTPLVPFVVAREKASAGVMITASHNPKDDNGYKVYWSNGCQIVSPIDQGIATAIEENLEVSVWDEEVLEREKIERLDVRDEYVGRVAAAVRWDSAPHAAATTPGFTYTPMHGVGLDPAMSLLERLNLQSRVHAVESQAQPDPDFPTVKFPNPEEKGALDEAIRTAREHGDKLILANDPDADRFAVAEEVDGSWTQLTGNQLGVLLASYVMEEMMTDKSCKYAMLASAVSSRMLAKVARDSQHFRFEETLTGFKWLGNKAQQLEQSGVKAPFAYEEAIGYMLSEVVYDKDGIAALALFLTAMRKWSSEGLTPWSKLQRLYSTYGYFEDANTYLISPSPQTTVKLFQAVRETRPRKIGHQDIVRWRDLTEAYDTATADHVPGLPVDRTAQMITCELENGVVLTARGSGTEPKIKLYVEGTGNSAEEAKAAAHTACKCLMAEWFDPAANGLKLA